MALDEKIFQSAIAKINRRVRSSSVPQVLVFEDPPHLRKPTQQVEVDKLITNQSTQVSEQKTDISNTINRIPTGNIEEKTPIKYGTEKGTNSSTEKGTEKTIQNNRVQYNDTKSSTFKGTKKGTEKGFILNKENNISLIIDSDFLYQRPYDALGGIPKKIVDVIYEICRKFNSRETPPVPFSAIVRLCKEKKNSVKVARQRLLEEGIIISQNSSHVAARGRSGMLIYKLRNDIFDDIDNSLSLLVKHNEVAHKSSTKSGTNHGTSASSSSSIKLTTTTDLPDEWKKIDATPLRTINFGIVELRNIYKKCPYHITPEIIQDSINQFSFGLENNAIRYNSMKSPAAVLVNQLCQGIPWKEDAYQSLEEKRKADKERMISELLESQFKEPKFLEWYNQLSNEEKDQIVPNGVKNSVAYSVSKDLIQKDHARSQFTNIIWPKILEELKSTL